MRAWQRAAVTIGFLRANSTHAFRFSFLPLLPTLCGFCGNAPAAAAGSAAAADAELNADRFIDSRFAAAHIVPAAGRHGAAVHVH